MLNSKLQKTAEYLVARDESIRPDGETERIDKVGSIVSGLIGGLGSAAMAGIGGLQANNLNWGNLAAAGLGGYVGGEAGFAPALASIGAQAGVNALERTPGWKDVEGKLNEPGQPDASGKLGPLGQLQKGLGGLGPMAGYAARFGAPVAAGRLTGMLQKRLNKYEDEE